MNGTSVLSRCESARAHVYVASPDGVFRAAPSVLEHRDIPQGPLAPGCVSSSCFRARF